MKNKPLTLILIVLAATITAFKITSANKQTGASIWKVDEDKWTILERIQIAKEKGIKKIILPQYIGIPAEINDLDDALRHFTVVVATPVEQLAKVTETQDIVTWYKLRIKERISQQNLPDCDSCGSSASAPEELLPLNADEIIMAQPGGTIVVDGITITQPLEVPTKFSADFSLQELPTTQAESGKPIIKAHQSISTSKPYLFVIELKNQSVAILPVGPQGIFVLNPDGTLEAISNKPDTLETSIRNICGNSLQKLSQRAIAIKDVR